MNTIKFDGSNTGRVSEYQVENYTGFKVFMVLLVLAIVALVALFSNIKASHAMSTARYAACQNVLSVIATPHNPIGNNPHPACVPYNKGTAQKDTSKKDNTAPAKQADTKVTLSLPVVTVEHVESPVIDTESNDTPAVNAPANPGNDKSVGNAGEKCDKSMCENSDGQSGEHGKSAQD